YCYITIITLCVGFASIKFKKVRDGLADDFCLLKIIGRFCIMENKLQFKWGNELFDDDITNIPQCFARFGRQFMSARQVSFVIGFITYQYGQDSPYPSQKTIADNMGVGTRQIRKWITSLEEKDLIEISFRYSDSGKRTSNEYSFKKLTDKCLKHSNDLKTKK